MVKSGKKVKKIREIDSGIKIISSQNKSGLESGVQQEDIENFGEFISSSGKIITPVLDASQEEQEVPEISQSPGRGTAEVQDSRNIYETSRSDYASLSSGSRPYISQTSETPVDPGIKQSRVIQNIPGAQTQHNTGFRDLLEDESPADERRKKYQSELERRRSGDKTRYAWE